MGVYRGDLAMEIKDTREEIIRRSKVYIEKRNRQVLRMMESASVALIAALVIVMQQFGINTTEDMSGTYYGTLVMGKDVGAYILVGLICFMLGVLITLIAGRRKDGREE